MAEDVHKLIQLDMYVRVVARQYSFQIQTRGLSLPTVLHRSGECVLQRSKVPVLQMSDKPTYRDFAPEVVIEAGLLPLRTGAV